MADGVTGVMAVWKLGVCFDMVDRTVLDMVDGGVEAEDGE